MYNDTLSEFLQKLPNLWNFLWNIVIPSEVLEGYYAEDELEDGGDPDFVLVPRCFARKAP